MISVILCAGNDVEALRHSLRCVRAQRDATWEAVVMVDPQHDSALTVARQFGDHRIRAYRAPGESQIAWRNAALEVVRGAVIALLEPGDAWLDGAHLSRVCRTLKNGEALVHQGGFIETGAERHAYIPTLDADDLRTHNPLLVSGLAYPSVMHDWLGGFDLSMGEEWLWDWCLRVTMSGVPLRTLPEPSVSARASTQLEHPAHRARDLHALERKHGLHGLRPSHPWAHRTEYALPEQDLVAI
jgi:glycosyltransferase involved in cell wall biosynthesis